jgi:multidrug efflux system membrane fusion protein
MVLAGFGAVCVVGYLAFDLAHQAGKADHAAPDRAQVVSTAIAARADAPVYLTGIGTVQPYATALIRAQVDGQLVALGFKEGASVRRGAVLAELDSRALAAQLAAARAAQARDQAHLDMAQIDLKRDETLRGQDSIAGQQVDAARALVAQDLAAVRNDQALVDYARVQLGYARITSPIDGVAGIRKLDVGAIVHASDATGLVTVSQVQPIAVMVSLPDKDLATLKPRLAGGVTAIARDRTSGAVADRGVVEAIDNQIDLATGAFKLKARFPNAGQTLWPGQAVDVALLVGTEKNAVVVPAAATVRGPAGLMVFVVGKDQSVRAVPVTVGATSAGVTIIESGVQPGDEVVVEGQYKLEPGARIRRLGAPLRVGPIGADPG